MFSVEVLAGVLMIGAAIALLRYNAPVDGKANPKLKRWIEPYVVVGIIGLTAFGIIMTGLGITSMFG